MLDVTGDDRTVAIGKITEKDCHVITCGMGVDPGRFHPDHHPLTLDARRMGTTGNLEPDLQLGHRCDESRDLAVGS